MGNLFLFHRNEKNFQDMRGNNLKDENMRPLIASKLKKSEKRRKSSKRKDKVAVKTSLCENTVYRNLSEIFLRNCFCSFEIYLRTKQFAVI